MLHRMSKKRAALAKAVRSEREAFRQRGACDMCGMAGFGHHVHEIASGTAGRPLALSQRCAWLLLCYQCHEEIHDKSKWPIARQLLLKMECDPSFYDRIKVNTLRGRQPETITQSEVMAFMPLFE